MPLAKLLAMIPILSIYGPSGAGKTTWFAKVLRELARREVRCGAVKVCHHKAAIEPLHKDSSRILDSGAQRVLLLAPGKKAILEARSPADSEEIALENDIIEFAQGSNFDIVCIEGARRSSFPKVAVNFTGTEWNVAEPFPLLARAGEPPVFGTAPDWSDPATASREIQGWISLREVARGISGVILAGGDGTRLGNVDKAGLVLEGMTLFERSNRLLKSCLAKVAVATPRPWEFDGGPVITDAPDIPGPLGGVLSALRECDTGVLVLGVDQFAISVASIMDLLRTGMKHGAAVLAPGGRPQWNVIFISRGQIAAVEAIAAAGERSLRACAQAVSAIPVSCPESEAADVDVPHDLMAHGITLP